MVASRSAQGELLQWCCLVCVLTRCCRSKKSFDDIDLDDEEYQGFEMGGDVVSGAPCTRSWIPLMCSRRV
jgi:hypothetical protein